jgi:8-oxo-dGTP pyrophosphatase MutT (NUDIX family)
VARLQEYYRDPRAPAVRGILPASFAVVRDDTGRVLLVQRADDELWELPGGRIEIGESASAAAVREVAEEAGVDIELTGLSGVYSEPGHVLVYADGARQQLAVCFHAVPRDGQPSGAARPDEAEIVAAGWFDPDQAAALAMHPAVRRRLRNALTHPTQAHFD